jgi:hypothetical protein
VIRRGSHIFQTNRLTDGGEAVDLMRRPRFNLPTQGDSLFLLEVQSTSRFIVRLEGLCKFKTKSNDLIGILTRHFPACSTAPQPTKPPTRFFFVRPYSPFVRTWPLFQFTNTVRNRKDSLDGGSARRKAATYTQDNTNTE